MLRSGPAAHRSRLWLWLNGSACTSGLRCITPALSGASGDCRQRMISLSVLHLDVLPPGYSTSTGMGTCSWMSIPTGRWTSSRYWTNSLKVTPLPVFRASGDGLALYLEMMGRHHSLQGLSDEHDFGVGLQAVHDSLPVEGVELPEIVALVDRVVLNALSIGGQARQHDQGPLPVGAARLGHLAVQQLVLVLHVEVSHVMRRDGSGDAAFVLGADLLHQLLAGGSKEPDAEGKEDVEEDEESLLVEWWIGGLVFSSLRCLLETWTRVASCSRDPGQDACLACSRDSGVAVCLIASKCGNCMGGIGLDKAPSGHLAREVGEKTRKKESEAPPSLFLTCKASTEQQRNTPDVTFAGCPCRRKSVIVPPMRRRDEGEEDEGGRVPGGRQESDGDIEIGFSLGFRLYVCWQMCGSRTDGVFSGLSPAGHLLFLRPPSLHFLTSILPIYNQTDSSEWGCKATDVEEVTSLANPHPSLRDGTSEY
ncbi:hypothetical protein EYF80_027575 [Liparis tanakae]|uniref:Uncharacterized protein n=1 Tax=Liparis tanakae TaxID=230148 RepID=A0A4Z2HA96_9TELE|nr:hypothetical protein EYF80_027575 [Liparis tanakae]